MAEEKTIKLSQAAKKLNLSIDDLIYFLNRRGLQIEKHPIFKNNLKIAYSTFLELVEEFEAPKKPSIQHAEADDHCYTSLRYGNEFSQETPATEPISQLKVSFEIPENLSKQATKELILDALRKLDNFHRDLGGNGLQVRDLQLLLEEKLQEVMQ